MSMQTLQDLFIHELKDLDSAEKQLTEALPKMAKAASSADLQQAFSSHLKETEGQLDRVHKLLHGFEVNPGGTTCDAMKGLVEEGGHAIKMKAPTAVKDAALIGAAQRVEHYEMAGYGTARAFAQALGHKEAVKVLSGILEEEAGANETLTKLAVSQINPAALKAK